MNKWFSFLIANDGSGTGSLALGRQRGQKESSMKKDLAGKVGDELRPEYDLSRLKGGVRGKYFRRATAGTNLVLIDPELASLFPDSAAVNRALRVLADAAQAQAGTLRKVRRTRVGERAFRRPYL